MKVIESQNEIDYKKEIGAVVEGVIGGILGRTKKEIERARVEDDDFRSNVSNPFNSTRFQAIQFNGTTNLTDFDRDLRKMLIEFQEMVTDAVKTKGWDGKYTTDPSTLQWSFAGALLYAVTVITTIGTPSVE